MLGLLCDFLPTRCCAPSRRMSQPLRFHCNEIISSQPSTFIKESRRCLTALLTSLEDEAFSHLVFSQSLPSMSKVKKADSLAHYDLPTGSRLIYPWLPTELFYSRDHFLKRKKYLLFFFSSFRIFTKPGFISDGSPEKFF